MTNKYITKIANSLNFKVCKGEFSHGEKIFTNKKYFISYDNTSHKGGFWKMATSIKDLKNKNSRLGTYNKNLTKCIDN